MTLWCQLCVWRMVSPIKRLGWPPARNQARSTNREASMSEPPLAFHGGPLPLPTFALQGATVCA